MNLRSSKRIETIDEISLTTIKSTTDQIKSKNSVESNY